MIAILNKAYVRKGGICMKFGMRKPSLKKSISARTTGRAKRAVKRALIPGYGKRGCIPRRLRCGKRNRKLTGNGERA